MENIDNFGLDIGIDDPPSVECPTLIGLCPKIERISLYMFFNVDLILFTFSISPKISCRNEQTNSSGTEGVLMKAFLQAYYQFNLLSMNKSWSVYLSIFITLLC